MATKAGNGGLDEEPPATAEPQSPNAGADALFTAEGVATTKPTPDPKDPLEELVREVRDIDNDLAHTKRWFRDLSVFAICVALASILTTCAFLYHVYIKHGTTTSVTTGQTETLTEDRVRELVNEGLRPALAPVGELPQLLEKIQAEVQKLERANAEDKDRVSRSIQGLSQRLADETDAERRETEKLRQEIMELDQRLARAEQLERTGTSTRPTPSVVESTPPPVRPTPTPPPPARTPRTINDPVVTITFSDVPAHGDTAPVEFRFIHMTEAGRVSVERPDTKPNTRPEWLPVRVVRDQGTGVLWGVLSLPVRADGERLILKYVSHYPPRSAADWGRISASTSFYRTGTTGDGLSIVVNPRAGTATRGTIR